MEEEVDLSSQSADISPAVLVIGTAVASVGGMLIVQHGARIWKLVKGCFRKDSTDTYLNPHDMQGYQQNPELVVMQFVDKPSLLLEAEIWFAQKDIANMREQVADLSGQLGKIENKLRFYPSDKLQEAMLKPADKKPALLSERKMCSDQLDSISIAIKVKEGLVDAYRQALVILPSRVEHTLAMQRLPARELFISATRRGGSQALARVRALVPESDLFKILSFIRESGLGGEGDGQAEGRAVEDEVRMVEEEPVAVPRSPAGHGRARAGSVSSRASSVGRRR